MTGAPRFVVTSCARSGTLFMANALARLGHACEHEGRFTPSTTSVPDFGRAQGDVSWLAAPFLADLPSGTVVVHQIREPLATIRSLVGVRMFQTRPHPLMQLRYRLQYYHVRFARPITNARFIRFAEHHCPGVFDLTDEPSRAAYYWVFWHRMIASAADRADVTYERLRMEDLDAERLAHLDHLLGGRATVAEAAEVRADLGGSTHRARQVDTLTLDDIGDEPTRRALVELAGDFGYELADR
jgi:hypothetical protein